MFTMETFRGPPEDGRGKKSCSLLEPPEEHSPAGTLTLDYETHFGRLISRTGRYLICVFPKPLNVVVI